MFIPSCFAENRPEEWLRIIRTHALGILVTQGDFGLDADHLPFEFDPEKGTHGVLTAHVARDNPVWQRCPTGSQVMVIFRGADAYISANWYPSKHESHRQVPTWNYEAVHAYGTLTIRDDQRFVRGMVGRLTKRHESAEPKPWNMSDAPPEYITDLLNHIVGIEIDVTSIIGKSKLSQNKEQRDRDSVVANLAAHGHEELVNLMKKGA